MQRPAGRRGGLGRAEVPGLHDHVVIPKPLSDRVNQLINGVHPKRVSEQRRHGIADYVRRLIVKCFQPEDKVEAFMFGSVPLRTYLPDGDIDVSIFCDAKGLQDTWCDKLSAVLEHEADNPDAEYKVANVSLINAEDPSEATAALDTVFKNTWLAQQRPRLSTQSHGLHPQPPVYTVPSKPGNAILDLLKDPHKEDGHDRESIYGLPSFPQMHGTMPGSIPGVPGFPPPPPVGPEDKGGAVPRSSDGTRGLHTAQHMRNLFEMQSMKNDGYGGFNVMQPAQFVHPYQAQLYNSVAMKYLPQHTSHRHRGELGLRRVHSAPNIGEVCLKRKDKNPTKRYPPFPVQPRKPLEADVKPKVKDTPMTKTEALRSVDMTGTTSDGRSKEKLQERSREPFLSLPMDVVEKLKPIEAKLMASERKQDYDSEKSHIPIKDALDPPRESEIERCKWVDVKSSRAEMNDHLIVIGEPPEPTALMSDYHRMDRDYYNQRPMIRRQGRTQEYHPSVYIQDVRNPLMQLNGPRPGLNRPVLDRPMQAVMEMAPNGELVASYTQLVPCMINHQFQQPMYSILSTQGEPFPTQMPPPRPTGTPNVRHPNVKMDGRNPLIDLFPGGYQHLQWFRPEERRLNGVTQGWSYPFPPVNGHARPRDDVPIRDADDVLSGDIETLTQQLEVARNFIGCKVQNVSDRGHRSRMPEKPPSNSNVLKGAPSPTVPNRPPETRPASRERPSRNQLEQPSPFAHHPQMATPVGFHGNFPTQPNMMYQVPAGFVAHPPPPGVMPDRMPSEGDLLAQLHAGMNPGAGYNYQTQMRNAHIAMSMNMGPQHTVPNPMMDPSMQLPPQPPRSTSPARSKDPPVVRSNKSQPCSAPSAADEHSRMFSVTVEDGRLLEIDASVYQAVRAAMAGKGTEDPPTGKDKISPRDGPSPRRTNEERLRSDDPPMHPTRRQLEEGVICYKDFPPFIANRPPMGGDYVPGHVPNQMAHLFNLPNATPTPDLQPQPRPSTTSYGTGSFIPLSSHFATEQRKAREQAEKEAQMAQVPVADGTVEDGSWSTRSGSNNSEKTDPNDARSHPPRGRFSPQNGQWSTSTSSNRSFVQTPPRGYPPPEHRPMTNATADGWPMKPDRSSANALGLKDYFKDYGEIAHPFVSTEAVTRLSNHGGNYMTYPSVSSLPVQGYQDYPAATAYHMHAASRQGHPVPYNQGVPRNRRDADRWTPMTRDKTERSPTPDSHGLIRRATDSDRWESKRPMPKPHHTFFKPPRENEDDNRAGLEQFFRMQPHRSSLNARHHRHRTDRRNTFREEDFPTLGSTPTSKRTSPPSSPQGTPKGENKTPTGR